MNHSIVTVKGSLSKIKLNDIILKINKDFFKNVYTIINDENYWSIKYKEEWQFGLGITIDSKRKLHLRPSNAKFSGWASVIFQNQIALLLNGTCSDEGIGEKWKPEENIYPTFKNYWDVLHNSIIYEGEDGMKLWHFFCKMYEVEINSWPKELKQFAGTPPDPNILPSIS